MRKTNKALLVILVSLSCDTSFAGFADGMKQGSAAANSAIASYDAARAKQLAKRRDRESRREGKIDYINANYSRLVSNRIQQLMSKSDAQASQKIETRPSTPAAFISGDTEAGTQGGVVKIIDGKACYWVGSGYSCDAVN
jgi:hypothetical protein